VSGEMVRTVMRGAWGTVAMDEGEGLPASGDGTSKPDGCGWQHVTIRGRDSGVGTAATAMGNGEIGALVRH
jgi:hypothetical protein